MAGDCTAGTDVAGADVLFAAFGEEVSGAEFGEGEDAVPALESSG